MMAEIFRCARCKIPISCEVQPLSRPLATTSQDGQPHIPQGYFLVSDGSYYSGTEGAFLLNLEDAINTKHHHLRSRLNGCCGLDGCDGFNTLCMNGHEIGTEKSDCWMAHALVLDNQRVKRESNMNN